MKNIKLKFSKNSSQKLVSVALKYRYLIFFIIFSVSLALAFGFIYKYIYSDMNFLEYEESYESRVAQGIKTNDRILKEILKKIENRNEELRKDGADYNNFFKLMDSEILKTDIDNNVNGNVDNYAEEDSTYSSLMNNPIE
jgi:hypothetical protein